MKIRKISIAAFAATALIALGCGAGSTVDSSDPVVTGAPVAAGDSTKAPEKAKAPAAVLTPKDITLKVKVLSKQCFGSAGCHLEMRISSVTVAPGKLDPSASYEITYRYDGLEDPVENRFVLDGTGKGEVSETEFGSTKRKSDKVTAVVTSVEKL